MSDEHYRQAGVDLDAAQHSVALIKPLAEQTRRPGVMEGIGGFGALFSLKQAGLWEGEDDLVLVSSTDGVGTKLKLAFELNRHDSIGIDCVAMCVNDIVTTGAQALPDRADRRRHRPRLPPEPVRAHGRRDRRDAWVLCGWRV